MFTNEKEKRICEKYGVRDAEGYVHCSECPLVRPSPYSDVSCKATAHYDRHLKEWVPDEVEKKQMDEYKYGMRLRGFSLGCQPMEGLIEYRDDPTGMYYNILLYSRKLEEWELENFELDDLEGVDI